VWGADARRLFFEGGSTIDAEAWNILGTLSLKDLSVSKHPLLEPTENIYVCRSTGHLFTDYGEPIGMGDRRSRFAVEYDPDMRSQRVVRFPAGHFSANCRYVATETSPHGPTPWGIFELATGRELAHFDLTGEGHKDEFEFLSWNPRRDHLYLRVQYPRSEGNAIGSRTSVELVDLRRSKVLESFPSFSEDEFLPPRIAWTGDGEWLIIARKNCLVFHPTP
jgi:hypothetical protein